MPSDAGATTRALSDKTLARRRYFREKQREYRRKLNIDGAVIEAEVVHLQSVRDGLQAMSLPSVREASDGPLSWCSIAMVFKTEARRVLTDRQSLVTQTEQYRTLMTSMQRFVMMNIPPPISRRNAWHNATLVAEPSARSLGKEWLTQQMYHNMHEAFALFPAVGNAEEFCQYDVQPSEDGGPIVSTETVQCTWPGTVQMFRRFVESNMRAVIFRDPQEVVEERTANTRLFHSVTTKGTFVNSLQGHFVEADRFIMVMRQVEHDEVHLCDPLRRQRHYRIEVRQESTSHILMRFVSHSSHAFRPANGYVSIDELAALCGIDVTGIEDDDEKAAYVRLELIRRGNADFEPWRNWFMGLMMQASLQQPAPRAN
ncbi:hypothetical protein H257_07628 [Aphanomyces astaci]|uniref:Uncharacterized protein n=1 Tax=Aphanomyces astaci TaxID=112090 RepID=W4GIM8_APHAT|nr:hypothetical protein H257_07628 [Aphanomyces astaci]ETV78798.1 hypothetical protein H257_07628 [Aphanomyces astaci]|eukprot:XP_009831517.1 hypothetical protein H257_07628 [Aphanomyces astaci]